MVVFGKGGCIRENWLYTVKSCCNLAKAVVFGQGGCIRSKVVVFGKINCIRAMWLYSSKVDVFCQKWL